MYLNLYLNKNLNINAFQLQIYEKIQNLLKMNIAGIEVGRGSGRTLRKLLDEDKRREYISLNRNIDGSFNMVEELDGTSGAIINEVIIRDKYNFIIDESCNKSNTQHYSTVIKV